MHNKLSILLLWLLISILGGCTNLNSRDGSVNQDLREAFERYLTVTNEALITFETTELTSVTTGDELKNTLNYIETYKKLEASGDVNTRSSEEFEIEWLEVIASGTSWAVVEAKKSYLTYSQNVQTGEKIYADSTRWRIQRFLFVKENGVWKVDRILEQVNWSG